MTSTRDADCISEDQAQVTKEDSETKSKELTHKRKSQNFDLNIKRLFLF